MAREIGIVKSVSGSARATAADGSIRTLQAGDRVFDTDVLATAAGSSIVVELADGSSVDMGANDSMPLGAALREQSQEAVAVAPNPTSAGPSAEDIQAALLAGADPTQIADPTAAGAPGAGPAGGGVAGNEGHVPVSVDYLNPVAPVTNGFDTTGPSVAFNDIAPEVLLLNPGTLPGEPITGGNLPPVAGDNSIGGQTPGTPAVLLRVHDDDFDPDGPKPEPSTIQLVGSAGPGQSLVVAGEGVWSVDSTNGNVTFTPEPGFLGNPTPIKYTVTDNLGLVSNQATISVGYIPTVAATNATLDETSGRLETTGHSVLLEPNGTGSLSINGQAPVSVTLAAAGATWDAASKTLEASTYRITVHADGSYEFALKEALPHPGLADAASAPIQYDISAVLTGTNGAVANTAFTASVFDDGPTVGGRNGQLLHNAEMKDAAGESLSGLIQYDLGFDGFGSNGGIALVKPTANVTSLSDSVSFTVLDTNNDGLDELYAYVDNGPAGFGAEDRLVFTLLPTHNGTNVGDYTLTLESVLDLPAAAIIDLNFAAAAVGPLGNIAVGNSLLITGAGLVLDNGHVGVNGGVMDKGESVTYQFGTVNNFGVDAPQLVNGVRLSEINVGGSADSFKWTAYRGGAEVGSKAVSYSAPPGGGDAPAIVVDGGYDTLKIEVISGSFEVTGLKYSNFPNTQTLPLPFDFVATDGDGDSKSGSFSVQVGTQTLTHLTDTLAPLNHPDSVVSH
ncbi:retention module-containing protein [Methylomonas sp. DH-1]|uniref:retention module-containing protein n=1 Tax=Methylomonas sp. (strain DH-1) TaxID=1727196 RepID=UPI0007C88DC7|nr:retention module-containing protein [Methylomonas sp. DH-1]ANE57126.1 hypothetical protein AYM39_19390 [Methylomonas sp. DH-1]